MKIILRNYVIKKLKKIQCFNHFKRRKVFQRRRFVVHQAHDTVMADIIFYDGHKAANDGYGACLTLIGKYFNLKFFI